MFRKRWINLSDSLSSAFTYFIVIFLRYWLSYIMIMNQKKIYFYVSLLAIFLITSCGDIESNKYKTFADGLHGVWVSTDTSIYSGKLEINIDRIIITGFKEGQTPSGEDINNRPFKNFTKDVPLKGYSEEGKIFIEDIGLLQEGIPYTLYTIPTLNTVEDFLRFTFGNRLEIMKKEKKF